MFCGNCGHKIEENVKFCPQCGATLQEQTQPEQPTPQRQQAINQEQPMYQQPAYQQPVTQPKKSKKGKVIGIIAAIAVILVAVLAFNAAAIANFFKKTFSSDEVYLKSVTQNSAGDIAENIGTVVDKFDTDDTDASAKGSLTVKLGKQATELLKNLVGADLSWAESATMDIETHTDDDKISVDAIIKLNQKDIIEVNTILDMKTQNGYVQLPGYNEDYISISLSEAMGGESFDYEEYKAQIEQIYEMLPDSDTIEKLVNRYVGIIFDCIEKTDKEADTLELNDLAVKCDKYTVTIDGEFIVKATKAVLTEAKKDKDLKEIIKDFAAIESTETDADEFYSSFQAEIDGLLSDIESSEIPEINYSYDTWVNGKGDIIGLYASIEGTTISYTNLEKGKNFATDVTVTSGGQSVSFTGEGKISGNKKSGDFTLKYMGIDIIEIEVTDFNTKTLEEGYLNGTFEIKPSSAILATLSQSVSEELNTLLQNISLKMDIKDSKKSGEYTISLNNADGEILSMSAEGKTIGEKKIKIPSDTVSVENESDLEEWASKIDPQKLIDALKKAGVPEDLLSGINSFGSSSSNALSGVVAASPF